MKKILFVFIVSVLAISCKHDDPMPLKPFADITYLDIKQMESKFGNENIMINETVNLRSKTGLIIFYRTQKGILGKLRITDIAVPGPSRYLTFEMVNYTPDGSRVLFNKSGVIIKSTYSADLDLGIQTSNNVDQDFGWNQQGLPDSYSFTPLNTAKFYVYSK